MAVSELQKVNLADGDQVALPIVRRGEDRLLLADGERHRLGRDLDLARGLGRERSRPGPAARAGMPPATAGGRRFGRRDAWQSAASRRDVTGSDVRERGGVALIIAHAGRGRIVEALRRRAGPVAGKARNAADVLVAPLAIKRYDWRTKQLLTERRTTACRAPRPQDR